MNEELKDYYKILGVTPDASIENIRKARERELAQNWSNPIGRVEIERAYSVISNPETRREYDEKLKQMMNSNELAKRNAKSLNEYEKAAKGFEFYVDPQTLKEYDEINNLEPQQVEESVVEEPVVEEPEIEEPKEEFNDVFSSSDHQVHNLLEEEPKEEFKDVFSSSDHQVHDLFENDVNGVENNKKPEINDNIIPIREKDKKTPRQKKDFSKFQKRVAYVGSLALFGIPGVLVTYIAMRKLEGKKFKLHRNKHKKISEVKIQETKLIEEYNNNLDKQINELLAVPNNNYNLAISKVKYENQVELLKKRIELKLSENVKKGHLTQYKLSCVALKNQLERAQQRLASVNSKINDYNQNQKTKKSILNYANKNLYEANGKVKQAEEEKRFSIKKLNINKENLIKNRDFVARRLKANRNFVGKIQDGAIKAFDCARSVKEVFTPFDEINPFDIEETNLKTR